MERQPIIAGGFALLLLCAPAAAEPAATEKPKPLSDQSRLAIIRVLDFEYATARQPLPASQKLEEALEVSSQGVVNEDKLRDHLAARGAAVHTGEVVQVTAIQFKSTSILFEINGGGKKKKKWYERIQVQAGSTGRVGVDPPRRTGGPGTGTSPPPTSSIGSWVVVKFSDYVPDLGPAELKEILAEVLDFSQRSAAVPWIDTIPEEFREAIKQKKAIVGMTREMVLAALGRPQSKVREVKDGVQREDWLYGNPPFVTFVTFEGDTVAEVKEFH